MMITIRTIIMITTILCLIFTNDGVYGQTCNAGEGATYMDIRTENTCDTYMTDENQCREATQFNQHFDRNNGFQMSGNFDSSFAKGCVYNSGSGYYFFNTNTESTAKCSSENKCICNMKQPSCTQCLYDYYSPGGEGVRCTKCPSDKPHTYGYKNQINGSTSVDRCCYCCDSETHQYGYDFHVRGSDFNGNEYCTKNNICQGDTTCNYIKSIEDCKLAAKINFKFDNNEGFEEVTNNHQHPPGCYVLWNNDDKASENKVWKYYFNTNVGCHPGYSENVCPEDPRYRCSFQHVEGSSTCVNGEGYTRAVVCRERICKDPIFSSGRKNRPLSLIFTFIVLCVVSIYY